MAAFDRFPVELYPPAWGAEIRTDRRVLVAPFGDGYEQIAPDGINTDVSVFAVSWPNVPEEISAPVYAFLSTRLKITPFFFRIPALVGLEEVLVMCNALTLTYPENKYTIKAELQRKYYLGSFA